MTESNRPETAGAIYMMQQARVDDPVEVAERRIRDIVNTARRRSALLQNRQQWFRLCSAMDVIGDTQLAVRAFLDEPMKDAKSDGWSYLVVYGILQVLYVQQDAATTLASCLKVSLELPDEIQAIRENRNDSIGHPTGRGTSISRITLSPEGFQLRVPVKGGRAEFRYISVTEVAEEQTRLMGNLLNKAVEQLVADELEHRKTFRSQPLRSALPHTLGYGIEKISEGLRDTSSTPFAFIGIDSIRAAVKRFREMVDERGLTVAYEDSVGQTTAEVDFALGRIEARLNGGLREWTELDADVYWFFLSAKVRELEELAAEIDADYDSDKVP
jgi:hypothetical protein